MSTNSDKSFWHHYIPYYESFFLKREISTIAEIGIFKGASIRWLLERFPKSTIYGADILDYQDEWPRDTRFLFQKLDQGNSELLSAFFNQAQFDLIIEDGSHHPDHQVLSLIHGIPHLKSNGLYILEDIHTSKPLHSLNKKFLSRPNHKGNALSVLLAIDHYKKINIALTDDIAEKIALNSKLTKNQVLSIDREIKSIHLYKRTCLPNQCVKCGEIHFNFHNYRCLCGTEIFSDNDSMAFVLEKK